MWCIGWPLSCCTRHALHSSYTIRQPCIACHRVWNHQWLIDEQQHGSKNISLYRMYWSRYNYSNWCRTLYCCITSTNYCTPDRLEFDWLKMIKLKQELNMIHGLALFNGQYFLSGLQTWQLMLLMHNYRNNKFELVQRLGRMTHLQQFHHVGWWSNIS